MPFGSVTSFVTSQVRDNVKNIADLQGMKMKTVLGSSYVLSPFYGKIRFFGAQVVYLDIYLVMGLGLVSGETLKYFHNGADSYSSTTVSATWDPSLNYGVGFKFFLNNSFSLFFDLRNYMSYSTVFGRRAFYSNFTASGGISIFLPGFG
jgi:outer membrane beta-barrel protein